MEVSAHITKEDYDQLYHLLRKFSNSGDELREPVEDIFVHLFKGPQYCHLLAYSKFYGKKYLLPKVIDTIEELQWGNRFKGVVDLGCGHGWLGLGISHHYNTRTTLVDKRGGHVFWAQTTSETYVINLEDTEGSRQVKDLLRDDDLVVMCDFLHCIENPEELLRTLAPWPMIILEYTSPRNYDRLSTFYTQLKRYGATAFSTEQLARMVREATGKVPKSVVLDPYLMLAVEGTQ